MALQAVLSILCVSIYLSAGKDPCQNAIDLPNARFRFVANVLDRNLMPPIDDSILAAAWYRVGNDDIPTKSPIDINRCGTRNPVFLNGMLPSAGGTTKNLTVYVMLSKTRREQLLFDIPVKSCGMYRVYFLQGTGESDSAYCFGEGDEAPIPASPLSRVEVQIRKFIDNKDDGNPKIRATCKFDVFSSDKYLYEVWWYSNENTLLKISETVYEAHLERTDIILEDFPNFKLGQNVSCKVTTKFAKNGPRGPSTTSENLFLGIKIISSFLHISENEYRNITVLITAPFFSKESNAYVKLNLVQNGCEGLAQTGDDFTSCSTRIYERDWNKYINISVRGFTEKTYSRTGVTLEVFLQTIKQSYSYIWRNYRLPPIKVHIDRSKSTQWFGRACVARNDPHMTTYDKRPYDIQYAGEFLLHRHLKHKNVQVQVRYESCNRNKHFPFCICGTAVQAGADVFIINKCSDGSRKMTEFTRCDDGILNVHHSGTTYTIYLPTGTTVKVSVNSYHLSIDVVPSELDFEQVEGLCGHFNDDCTDDLTIPNGSALHKVSSSKCHNLNSNQVEYHDFNFKPKDFSDAWLVNESDSLFRSKDKDLQRWSRGHYLCKCKETGDPKNPFQVDCSPNEKATCTPAPGKRVDFLLSCTEHTNNKRQKRSWREMSINRPSIHVNTRRRRSVTNSSIVSMTPDEAKQYCLQEMQKSTSYKMCSTIPNVNPMDSLATCITDIMISNSTSWTESSREALKSKCLSEISLNKTLREATAPGKKSIAEEIEEATCQNECSGKGVCKHGVCACDSGFGLADCSIDLKVPPDFHSLQDGGFCDVQEYQCTEAFVTGDDFAEDANASCKIRKVQMDREGNMNISDDEIVIPAEIRTMMSLKCPLLHSRHRRSVVGNDSETSFINGVAISLSNDGFHFGGEHIFFIFNSLCQVPGTINGKQGFLLKAGYCFIDGSCIRRFMKHSRYSCRECNPAVSVLNWSERTTNECAVKNSRNLPLIIGSVCGTVVLLALIGLAAYYIRLNMMKRKVSASMVFQTSTLKPTVY